MCFARLAGEAQSNLMEGGTTDDTRTVQRRYRWLFAYQVNGDLRFISHHDMLRFFRRALVRAGIAVRWSQGFNPHPRMSIPVPRPVGVASRAEYLVVETDTDLVLDATLLRLQQHIPPDIQLTRVEPLALGASVVPQLVRYELDPGEASTEDLQKRITEILSATTLPVDRRDADPRQVKKIDVRPYVDVLKLEDGVVTFTLRYTERGTAKPSEIAALLGFDPNSINHRICRTEIQWRSN